MRTVLALTLAALAAAGNVQAAETMLDRAPVGGAMTVKPGMSRQVPGIKGDVRTPTGGVMELSDSDCINLQCELQVFTSCTTRLGCKCPGTGVTICVDTIDPD